MINKYINTHYQEILGKVKGVTKNHELTEDLLQDCILAFLEKGPDYISKVIRDKKVQHYLIRMVHIQFNSSTSPFYTKYRKTTFKTRAIDNLENLDIKQEEKELKEDKGKLSDEIKLYIGSLPLFEKTISHRHLIDGVSQREMSRYYNINRTHISASIDNVKKNIRIKFNRDDYKTE